MDAIITVSFVPVLWQNLFPPRQCPLSDEDLAFLPIFQKQPNLIRLTNIPLFLFEQAAPLLEFDATLPLTVRG